MLEARITLYGTSWCSDCRRALRYQYINIERDDAARRYVEQVNNGNQSVPTIVFPDGSIMVEPSSSALAQKLASLNN